MSVLSINKRAYIGLFTLFVLTSNTVDSCDASVRVFNGMPFRNNQIKHQSGKQYKACIKEPSLHNNHPSYTNISYFNHKIKQIPKDRYEPIKSLKTQARPLHEPVCYKQPCCFSQ